MCIKYKQPKKCGTDATVSSESYTPTVKVDTTDFLWIRPQELFEFLGKALHHWKLEQAFFSWEGGSTICTYTELFVIAETMDSFWW